MKREFLEHKRLFVFLHLLFWSVFLIGIIVDIAYPEMVIACVQKIHHNHFFKWIAEIYKSDNIALAISLTFIINLIVGCLLTISVPSFFVSWLGVLPALHRAYLWGLLFLDTSKSAAGISFDVFHLVVMLLEGEAYILAMVAGCRVPGDIFHLKTWLSSRQEWLKIHFKYYGMILVVLLVSAVVEVFGVKCFLRLLHRS
jgi:hypothetical protein